MSACTSPGSTLSIRLPSSSVIVTEAALSEASPGRMEESSPSPMSSRICPIRSIRLSSSSPVTPASGAREIA